MTILSVLGVGCGHAQLSEVHPDASAGRIAVTGPYMAAMAAARLAAVEHCQGRVALREPDASGAVRFSCVDRTNVAQVERDGRARTPRQAPAHLDAPQGQAKGITPTAADASLLAAR